MPIARNNATQIDGGSGSPFTTSYSCSAGSDRLLIAAFFTLAAATVTGVTYNGVAMTGLHSPAQGGSDLKVHFYYLLNPASGSNTFTITFAADTTKWVHLADYTGVAQSGQPDDSDVATQASGSQLSVTLSATQSGDWAIGISRDDNGGGISWTNLTGLSYPPGSGRAFADSNGDVGSGDKTYTANGTGGNQTSFIAAIFKATDGGAAPAGAPIIRRGANYGAGSFFSSGIGL